jgi:hypothetical protein
MYLPRGGGANAENSHGGHGEPRNPEGAMDCPFKNLFLFLRALRVKKKLEFESDKAPDRTRAITPGISGTH